MTLDDGSVSVVAALRLVSEDVKPHRLTLGLHDKEAQPTSTIRILFEEMSTGTDGAVQGNSDDLRVDLVTHKILDEQGRLDRV